jgi:hypothetical protein
MRSLLRFLLFGGIACEWTAGELIGRRSLWLFVHRFLCSD